MKTNDYHWMLNWVKNQAIAFAILFFTGLFLSLILFVIFLKIGGFDTPFDSIYYSIIVAITLGPQISLYYAWIQPIPPQYEAEIMIFLERQGYWLREGLYLIPFKGWFIKLNKAKILRTSRYDDRKKFSFLTQDANGEVLTVDIDAEMEIVNPTKYEEFPNEGVEMDVVQILKNAAIRTLIKLKFKDDIAGKNISIADQAFINMCDIFGITFKPIMLVARLADPLADSANAKFIRLMKSQTQQYREETGKKKDDPLTLEEMEKIKEDVEMMLKLGVNKSIYEGISDVKPILPIGKK